MFYKIFGFCGENYETIKFYKQLKINIHSLKTDTKHAINVQRYAIQMSR